MQFLSDEWLDALDAAARSRTPPPDDPLANVRMTVHQIVDDGPSWSLVIDHGAVSVERDPAQSQEADPDTVRLRSDRATATDIAAGRRAALDAFITGDLVIGGDVRPMLEHRAALETLGELFAALQATTTYE